MYSFILYSANLQNRVRKGNMTREKFEKTLSLLKGVLDYESFRDVDLVIEVPTSILKLINLLIVMTGLIKCSQIINYCVLDVWAGCY